MDENELKRRVRDCFDATCADPAELLLDDKTLNEILAEEIAAKRKTMTAAAKRMIEEIADEAAKEATESLEQRGKVARQEISRQLAADFNKSAAQIAESAREATKSALAAISKGKAARALVSEAAGKARDELKRLLRTLTDELVKKRAQDLAVAIVNKVIAEMKGGHGNQQQRKIVIEKITALLTGEHDDATKRLESKIVKLENRIDHLIKQLNYILKSGGNPNYFPKSGGYPYY